jgi:hypothetical protein
MQKYPSFLLRVAEKRTDEIGILLIPPECHTLASPYIDAQAACHFIAVNGSENIHLMLRSSRLYPGIPLNQLEQTHEFSGAVDRCAGVKAVEEYEQGLILCDVFTDADANLRNNVPERQRNTLALGTAQRSCDKRHIAPQYVPFHRNGVAVFLVRVPENVIPPLLRKLLDLPQQSRLTGSIWANEGGIARAKQQVEALMDTIPIIYFASKSFRHNEVISFFVILFAVLYNIMLFVAKI